jgi:2-polyprenyl-6-methoxyphenol hydroxylase-like FAD-dependent oxidoreductase
MAELTIRPGTLDGVSIDRAVVLGRGMAGLSAAAALQPHVNELCIVDRDVLSATVEPRQYLPQSWQLHNMADVAWRNLDWLMPSRPGNPGYMDHLDVLGAGTVRVPRDMYATVGGFAMPMEGDFGIQWRTAERSTMELAALRVLAATGNVQFKERTTVRGLHVVNNAVAGVAIREESSGEQTILPADIVVDAMGAHSRMPRWLAEAGMPAPAVVNTPTGRWYAGIKVRRPQTGYYGDSFWANLPGGEGTASAMVSPIDPDHWQVSTSGFEDDTPPATFGEVKAHVASLQGSDDLIGLLGLFDVPDDQQLPPVFRLRSTIQANDHQVPLPRGLIRLGDAVSQTDPISGLGMSVATIQAIMVEGLAARHQDDLLAITEDSRRLVARAAAAGREVIAFMDRVGRGQEAADQRTIMRRLHMADVNPWQLMED